MRFRSEVGESLTLKFAEAAGKRRQSGQPIISLGLGEPDFATPPAIIEATQRVLGEGVSTYSSPLGVQALREQIANKLTVENGIACTANHVVVTAGAKQAFQLVCMAILEPGDEVVVVGPSFVSFVPQLCLAEPDCNIKYIDVAKDDYKFPLQELSDVVSNKTKLIVINSPNNPAGYVLLEEEIREIYALVDRSNAYLISDEIYEKLNFSDKPFLSPGSLETEPTKVITINGYSKSHAMTGWRLGYACIPASIRQQVLKIQQHMNTNTCTFIQKAVASVNDLDETYLHEYRKSLLTRSNAVLQWAEQTQGVSLVAPQAGFFAFLNVGKLGLSSNEFCGQLIESCGVATTPGLAFGAEWDDHIRLSYAVSEKTLSDGLSLMTQFVKQLNS